MATTTASLEEELQVKNQQVKQYKRQVDAVKADLDKCQTELRIARLQNALVEGFSLGDPGAPIKTRSKRDDQMVQQLMCSMSEKISSSHVTDDMGGGEEENKKLIREAESLHKELATLRSQSSTSSQMSPTLQFLANELKQQRASCTDVEEENKKLIREAESLHQELATLKSQSATSSQMSPTLQFLANELKQQRASCTDVEIHLERLQMENRDLVEKCSGLTMQLETTRKTTATMYQEDFEHERKDRKNLHGRLTQKEEELAIKEAELRCVRQQFEEELQTKNQQVKQYKRQVDAVKADLDKCQMELNQQKKQFDSCIAEWAKCREEAKRNQSELQQYKMQAELYKEKWETFEDKNGSSVDPQQNAPPIRPKTENVMMHNVRSSSSSPSGYAQGYRANPHTVQGTSKPQDHMIHPHPPPDLPSPRVAAQGGWPPPQPSSLAQYHNAGWSQYDEGHGYAPKLYVPPSSRELSNDFVSNASLQSLPVYPPSDNQSQRYGGNVMQHNQAPYQPRSHSQQPPALRPMPSDFQTRSDAEIRAYNLANQSSNAGGGGGAGIPRQFHTMAASRHEHSLGPSIPAGGNYYGTARIATNETIRPQEQWYRSRPPPDTYHEGFSQEGLSGDRPAPVDGDMGARGWPPRPDDEHVEEAPFDSNLTCLRCGECFRKGEIQNYKRHVEAHNYPTAVNAD